jgi:hypothetical protein
LLRFVNTCGLDLRRLQTCLGTCYAAVAFAAIGAATAAIVAVAGRPRLARRTFGSRLAALAFTAFALTAFA